MPGTDKSNSFRYKLIVLLVGLQIITVSLILIFSHITNETVLIGQARQILENAAKESLVHTKGFLRPAYRNVLTISDTLSRGVIDVENEQAIEQYFLTQLQQHPELSGIYISSIDGDFHFVSRDNNVADSVYRTKKITSRNSAKVSRLHWRDKSLQVIERQVNQNDSYNPLSRPWYKQAVKNNELIWTDPYVFFSSKKLGITIASPFYDEQQEIIGVLGIDIELSSLSDFLATLNIGQSGSAFIIDMSGKFVATSTTSSGSLSGQEDGVVLENDDIRSAAVSRFTSHSVDKPRQQSAAFTKNGVDYLAAFLPLDLGYGSLEWVLVTYAEENDFLQQIRHTEKLNILIGLFILMLSMFIGWILATRAWKPVADWHERAITDQLTGVFNRHHVYNMGPRLYERAKTKLDEPLSLVVVDIDFFKRVNDSYGHNVGDEVISGLAWRFQHELRPQDIIARYGGEEFLLFLPNTDNATAVTILERMQKSIKLAPIRTAVGVIDITVSAGLCTINGDTHLSFIDCIGVADKALYQAKNDGRDKVVSAGVLS